MVQATINGGLGATPGGLFAAICSGVAHASPIYGAFLIALAPFSFNRRVVFGTVWLGIVMSAMAIGNIGSADQGITILFSPGLVYALPVISLGWLIPFSYLHWFRGWRLGFPDSERQFNCEKITISKLLLLTFVVSICFFSLQFSGQQYITTALVGMLVTSILGSILAIEVWLVMRTRLAILIIVIAGFGCYSLFNFIFLQLGLGGMAFTNAMFITTVFTAALIGVFAFRMNGGVLLTGYPEHAE